MENIGLYIDSEVLKQCEQDPTIQGGIEIIRQEVINKLRHQLGLCRNFEERNSA